MKKPLRIVAAAALVVISAAGLTACSSESGATGAAGSGGDFKIGYMIWDTSVPFYSNLISSAKAEAKKEGASIDIVSGNGDLATQISVVQQFVSQGVDLIMISPSDPKGIVPAIRQANAANIPVMSVNTEADTSSGAKVVTYVGVNDEEFGKHQGELLIKALGDSGKVGYITGKLGTSAQIAREKGLKEALAAKPGIKIVSQQPADWDNAKALAVTQDLLNRYGKGELDAIVGQGPETTTGAKFASENGRTDVKFIVGDYPADVRNAIKAGYVYGSVDQDPSPQGTNAVKYAVAWLNGDKKSVPQPQAYIDMPIVTKDNVDDVPPAWGGK